MIRKTSVSIILVLSLFYDYVDSLEFRYKVRSDNNRKTRVSCGPLLNLADRDPKMELRKSNKLIVK